MTRQDYAALGGHVDHIRIIDDILSEGGEYGAEHDVRKSSK